MASESGSNGVGVWKWIAGILTALVLAMISFGIPAMISLGNRPTREEVDQHISAEVDPLAAQVAALDSAVDDIETTNSAVLVRLENIMDELTHLRALHSPPPP